MEKELKSRIFKKMLLTWVITIFMIAVLVWILKETMDFDFVNFTGLSVRSLVLVIIAVVIVIFLLTATINSLSYRKVINEFVIMNNMSKKALEEEFTRMTEICENYWVSPILTMYYDGNHFGIIKNAKLSKVDLSILQGSRGIKVYYLELYNREHEKIAKVMVDHNYQAVLDFYRENCPNISTF